MKSFWRVALPALLGLALAGCTDRPPVSPPPVTAGPCLDKETCTESLHPDPTGVEPGFAGIALTRIHSTRENPARCGWARHGSFANSTRAKANPD